MESADNTNHFLAKDVKTDEVNALIPCLASVDFSISQIRMRRLPFADVVSATFCAHPGGLHTSGSLQLSSILFQVKQTLSTCRWNRSPKLDSSSLIKSLNCSFAITKKRPPAVRVSASTQKQPSQKSLLDSWEPVRISTKMAGKLADQSASVLRIMLARTAMLDALGVVASMELVQ